MVVKILNLFAGIGGNRTLWGEEHEITAVDNNSRIGFIYKKRFPDDIVIVADAYFFLEKNYNEFDFIWASPPCETHSQMNMFPNIPPRLPDLRLYSIILFLRKWFKGNWIVENVIPYYISLIKPTVKISRHYFWSNFPLKNKNFKRDPFIVFKDNLKKIAFEFQVDYDLIPSDLRRKVLRNMIDPKTGKYILDSITKKDKIEDFTKWI